MPSAQLIELAKKGDFDTFETKCLEMIEGKTVALADLVTPFKHLEKAGNPQRTVSLTQLVLENTDTSADAGSALAIAKGALSAKPDDVELRKIVVNLYTKVYGSRADFEHLMTLSSLVGGRPARAAIKMMEYGLNLKVGETLIGRSDDRVVEVVEIDAANALLTLRRDNRSTTLPLADVAREYDPISPDDFRVLRQLRPQKLLELVNSDPVTVVVGLLHAHGEAITAETLKDELVPRYVQDGDWAKWWTKARGLLKRSQNVMMEGRSPVVLSYNTIAQTYEEECWKAFHSVSDPKHWGNVLDSYKREKLARKEEPSHDFLRKCDEHIVNYIDVVKGKRPGEAFACAFVLRLLEGHGLPPSDSTKGLTLQMLRDSKNPVALIMELEQDWMWEEALPALREALPDTWVPFGLALLPNTRAGVLDQLVEALVAAGATEAVQKFVDGALQDPVNHPELVYWLWKGPKQAGALKTPSYGELFTLIVNTLDSLLRTTNYASDVVKEFRARIKAALALKDYGHVRSAVQKSSPEAAITIRRQLDRLEGLGDNARTKLIDILRETHPHLWYEKTKMISTWEDSNVLWCTQEGLRRRSAERDEIQNVQMRDNARRIGEAASLGDLSENSEYKFALEERDLLRARLARINDELGKAQPIDVHGIPTDHVGVGTRVTLRDSSSGKTQIMTFLGPFETDVERHTYSYLAPFSQKLMGLHVGDRAKIAFDGHETEVEVIAIENGLGER